MIIANDNGYCRAEPMSPRCSSGTMANTVVSDVMTIGFSRMCPAVIIALSRWRFPALPSCLFRLYSLFIVSTFSIESLIIIPQATMMPIIDMMFSDSPQTYNANITIATSMTTSKRIIIGWTMLSNCAASMK